jgi:hypothetical protein
MTSKTRCAGCRKPGATFVSATTKGKGSWCGGPVTKPRKIMWHPECWEAYCKKNDESRARSERETRAIVERAKAELAAKGKDADMPRPKLRTRREQEAYDQQCAHYEYQNKMKNGMRARYIADVGENHTPSRGAVGVAWMAHGHRKPGPTFMGWLFQPDDDPDDAAYYVAAMDLEHAETVEDRK